MNNSITVPFLNSTLIVIEYNNEPFVPMRQIVEGMGLDWVPQFRKLNTRFIGSVAEIATQLPGETQRRSVTCLALRKLAAWLNSISANKVNPAIRDRVIQYQEKCDDVLYEYWMKEHGTQRTTLPALPQRFIVSMAGGEWKAQPIGNDEMVCNVSTLQSWIENRQHLDRRAVSELLLSCARRLSELK